MNGKKIKYFVLIAVIISLCAVILLLNCTKIERANQYDPAVSGKTPEKPDEPDETAPASPSVFSASTTEPKKIKLTWVNPSDSDFKEVVIVYRTDAFATSISGGTVVYTGTGTEFIHSSLNSGTTYFYSIYACDTSTNYSDGAITSKKTWNEHTITLDEDAYIRSNPIYTNSTYNNTQLIVSLVAPNADIYRTVLSFKLNDLATIIGSKTIKTGVIRLTKSGKGGMADPGTMPINLMVASNYTGWMYVSETQVTWNRGASDYPWQLPGGTFLPGGPISSANVDWTSSGTVEFNINASVIQDMKNNYNRYFAFILKGLTEDGSPAAAAHVIFGSKDGGSSPPEFIIYTTD
jgi:hypothetical protein